MIVHVTLLIRGNSRYKTLPLDYDTSPIALAVRTVDLQFVPRCVHSGIIDRERYRVTSDHAGVCHAQKMFPRTEGTAAKQEVSEH